MNLVGNYSEMKIGWVGSSNGASFNITSEYKVVSVSSGSFEVNSTEITQNGTLSYLSKVLDNGTAVWSYFQTSGYHYNYTGAFADTTWIASMATFTVESTFASEIGVYTASSYTHVASTGTVMLGPTSVSVTNYVANTLPLDISECGFFGTLNQFTIQVGTVAGKTLPLTTQIVIDGTINTGSGNENFNFTLKVLSLTKA